MVIGLVGVQRFLKVFANFNLRIIFVFSNFLEDCG